MKFPEKYRLKGEFGGNLGENGSFMLPGDIFVIAASGEGWEHVSVSLRHRTPTWREMCYVKSMFFDDEDCVMQLHPPKSKHINFHPHCLHLWRPLDGVIPQPPLEFV